MTTTALDWRPAPIHTAGAAADATRMDTVELLVGDLDAQTEFYRRAVTLDVLDQSGARATLGRDGIPIMTLTHTPDLPPFDRRDAGLYHTAIAFPDRAALSTAVLSMARQAPHLYEGATDHTFSNAFYFHDPEGNGIELYWDRPVEVWQNKPAGWMPQNTAIDPNAFLREHFDPARETQDEATIGHVHLQVGDIPTARRFYVDMLGFDVTIDVGSALFISAGGYHHHIGLNTWESAGGPPPAPGTTGLYHLAILYPTRRDLANALVRLAEAGIPLDGASDHGVSEALYLRDPDDNGVELYWDRPPEQWPRAADGSLAMYSRRLDLESLLREAGAPDEPVQSADDPPKDL